MKKWLVCIAAGCVLLGVVAVIISHLSPKAPPIPFPPPLPPYAHFIATVGVIEAATEDIRIGTMLSGIVDKIHVLVGDTVEKGTPLFTLEHSTLIAQLLEAEASYAVACAQYQKQLDLPRQEEIPIQQAIVDQSNTHYLDAEAAYQLVEKLKDPRAISQDEFNRRKYSSMAAKYQLAEDEASLSLLLAGAWIRELDIYREQRREAQAAVDAALNQIRLATVCAPCAGTVLRINISDGEFAQAGELAEPLLIFGLIDPLHIRIDVDEEEVWRVILGAPGRAYVRGNSTLTAPINYVNVEPYMLPKKTLSGNAAEFVDTRILQLIYKIDDRGLPIYPGELIDVYLEAKPSLRST